MLSLLWDVNNLKGMKSPDVHPTENISANHGSLFIASVAAKLRLTKYIEISQCFLIFNDVWKKILLFYIDYNHWSLL